VALLRGDPVPEVEPIEVQVTGRLNGPGASSTWPMWSVRSRPSGSARWRRPDATICSSTGRPGVGKTMLAERVPSLLPDLDLHDALEVSALHSLAGFHLADQLITLPPYRDPHHSATVVSMAGGGPRLAKPGAISVAHPSVPSCT
jgi:magnesium chelatase family protein